MRRPMPLASLAALALVAGALGAPVPPAHAQPAPGVAPPAGSAAAAAPAPAAGPGAAGAGGGAPGTADTAAPVAAAASPAMPPPAGDGSAVDPASHGPALRKTCVAAMNADPAFAGTIVRTAVQTDRVTVGAICADVATESAHRSAVTHVEKNQRHVIGAYAAIWVITALFLLYLLRRQTRLRGEIEQLRRDLEAAAKGGA